MDDLRHENELLKAELQETREEIDLYQRLIAGKATLDEIRTASGPVQELIALVARLQRLEAEIQEYRHENRNLRQEIKGLRQAVAPTKPEHTVDESVLYDLGSGRLAQYIQSPPTWRVHRNTTTTANIFSWASAGLMNPATEPDDDQE